MSAADKKQTLRRLVETGKARGNLSNQEVLDALAEINFSPEQIEKLYDKLEANGVEIVEDAVEDVRENEDIVDCILSGLEK